MNGFSDISTASDRVFDSDHSRKWWEHGSETLKERLLAEHQKRLPSGFLIVERWQCGDWDLAVMQGEKIVRTVRDPQKLRGAIDEILAEFVRLAKLEKRARLARIKVSKLRRHWTKTNPRRS